MITTISLYLGIFLLLAGQYSVGREMNPAIYTVLLPRCWTLCGIMVQENLCLSWEGNVCTLLVCGVISNVLSPLPITADEDLGLNSLNLFLVSFSCTAVQLCLYNVRGRAKIDSTKTGKSH